MSGGMKQWFSNLICYVANGCGIAILVLGSPNEGRAGSVEIVFPGDSWEERDPEELGLDPEGLDRLAGSFRGRGVVVKDGYVVKSWGALPRRGDWFGASNPLLSSLLFFGVEEGRIDGVDEPIRNYLWDLNSKDRTIALAHLANMTSGYAYHESAGETWAYSNLGVQLFQMTLFDRVYNAPPISVLLHRDRLGPLKFQDRPGFRERTNTFIASVRDYARLAWFWCQKGNWNGEQLLPAHYFDRFQKAHVSAQISAPSEGDTNDYLHIGNYRDESEFFEHAAPSSYGYGWWFNRSLGGGDGNLIWPEAPSDMFLCVGDRGNNAVIIPSLNLVLVTAYSQWGSFEPRDASGTFNSRIQTFLSSLREAN